MNIGVSLWYSFRLIFHQRSGSYLGRQVRWGILGIAFSLVPLFVVSSVADGMIQGITNRYLEVGTYHLQLRSLTPQGIEGYERTREAVSRLEPVQAAAIERRGLGIARYSSGSSGVTVRSVPPDIYREDEGFREYLEVVEGRFNLESKNSAVIGEGVAEDLRLGPGDEYLLLTVKMMPGGRMVPRITRLNVEGIVSTGYRELDALWVFLPHETGMAILDPSTSTQYIGIKMDKPFEELERVSGMVRQLTGSDWWTLSWYDIEKAQYKSFQTTRSLLAFIMIIIILVAVVNISSSMVMLVLDKRQEIGVMKSFGTSPGDLVFAFTAAGFGIGLVGSILGIAGGMLVSVNINEIFAAVEIFLNAGAAGLSVLMRPFGISIHSDVDFISTVYYLERIPISITMWEPLIIGGATVFLSTLTSYLPARRAGRIAPVDIFRKQ
ncbi:MAG: hypothetical protein K9L68_00905 [Spirochaetales bacterium]|nr:hypothetical protein [Spirochaetales bacterium]MCF7937134.1 hypothetical protein [Spirochaetales bacterium]